ncbi:MAG: hypothetical protein ACRDT8_22130 [Micromonosporaceae bacterium]
MPSPDALARALEKQRIRRAVNARLARRRRCRRETLALLAAVGLVACAIVGLLAMVVMLP